MQDIAARAAVHNLAVFGGFHAEPSDNLPKGTQTVLLLGPAEPGFWPLFTQSREWRDGGPDPMDRWSRRVIGQLACDLGAKALFPFGGPPHHPFYTWALRTGHAWASPVHLLVHDVAGLMVSYRGALALKERLALPSPPPAPCPACKDKPCLTACPTSALTGSGYDVPACHRYLDSAEGQACLSGGCAVRRACPLSAAYARMDIQSAYHMGQFHR